MSGLRALMQQPEWMADANCVGIDAELFFPQRGESTKQAKEVCRGCDVQAECLAYALNNGEKYGIWGGLSERERRRIRRQRNVDNGVVIGVRTVDYDEVARIASEAAAEGIRPARALSEHYGITVEAATHRIRTARLNGFEIADGRTFNGSGVAS